MSARAWSVAMVGMEGVMVEVEAALGGGLPRTVLVGLPDAALGEARDRCRAAMTSSGHGWPSQLLTINLSPASLPKAGAHFDLAIVSAVSAAAQRCDPAALESTVLLGELGLDGRVRPVRGVLPALLAASRRGFARAVVPARQVAEASLVEGLTVWGVDDLEDLFSVLAGRPPAASPAVEQASPDPGHTPDLIDVVGQVEARWALEVAAAGRHHLFLHGPPGVGKSLLAARLPGILPELAVSEALEVAAIHSLAGAAPERGLVTRPPYCDPHHSASVASLVGGGARMAMPGSISRAHQGVLFLDEAPEFDPRALEALRVPLESGQVVLARSASQVVYPARFQLVLAANPCPCGNAGVRGVECRCPPMTVRRYRDRVSGPILDRIDIHQQLRPMRQAYLRAAQGAGESTALVADRVRAARERQLCRLGPLGWRTNGEVPGPALRRDLPLPEGVDLLESAVATGRLSARGVDKVMRVAWTICDLAAQPRPTASHLRTALAMRRGEDRTEASHG